MVTLFVLGFRFGVNDYVDEVAEYVGGGVGRCGATTRLLSAFNVGRCSTLTCG